MRCRAATILFLAAFAGCSGGTPPGEPPPESVSAAPVVARAPDNVVEDMEWHIWPTAGTPGQDMKPLLTIRAETVTGMGDETGELAFENAEAEIPAHEAGDLEIRFKAARGRYIEGQKAVLEGGVTAQVDDMTISLEEITWQILSKEADSSAGGIATSDSPLRITSPTQQLSAASLRLDPGAKTLELRDVAGEITFTGDAL